MSRHENARLFKKRDDHKQYGTATTPTEQENSVDRYIKEKAQMYMGHCFAMLCQNAIKTVFGSLVTISQRDFNGTMVQKKIKEIGLISFVKVLLPHDVNDSNINSYFHHLRDEQFVNTLLKQFKKELSTARLPHEGQSLIPEFYSHKEAYYDAMARAVHHVIVSKLSNIDEAVDSKAPTTR